MSFEILKEREMNKTLMSEVLVAELAKQMEEDEKVCYLDADVMNSVKTKKLTELFPERAIDCGVTEANMMSAAAGMSACGLKPYVHTFGTFATRRAMDQIFLSGAYAKLGMRIIGSDPGVHAALNGGTHMPFEDMAVILSIPNITAIDLCDTVHLKSVLRQIKDRPGITYIRMPRKNTVKLFKEGSELEIGKGALIQDGEDVTIIASGLLVDQSIIAAEELAKEGIRARIVNIHTWRPLDVDMILESAKKTGAIVTAENHNLTCGLGAAVSRVVTEHYPVPVMKVGINEEFGEVGPEAYLRERFGLDAKHIIEAVKKAIALKQGK